MFCPRCGQENPAGARYCKQCGYGLGEHTSGDSISHVAKGGANMGRKLALIVAAAVIVVAAVIVSATSVYGELGTWVAFAPGAGGYSG